MSDKPEETTTTTPATEAATPAPAEAASSSEAAAAPASASAAPAASGEEEERVEGADSTAEYAPVVTLKPVEVTTGEENDETLYKQRAACYRFDAETSQWKERGRGDVKLLQNKENKSVRILLRQEKTLKLCMNHKIHPDIDLVPNAGSDRSWTWRTLDFSTEEAEKQTFALRFKDAETAAAFKAEYDKCREINRSNASGSEQPAQTAAATETSGDKADA